MIIKELRAGKIKDSRGKETIEVSVGRQTASAPSGKSTGKYENPQYCKSLEWNISAINSLKIDFPIENFDDLKKLEEYIEKTFGLRDAKEFGANALFALESAVLKALADSKGLELWQIINPNAKKFPIPVGNAVGGGLHSRVKGHPTFQEFLIIPKASSAEESVFLMNHVYKELGRILGAEKINDEGAWETSLSEEQILEILSKFKDKVELGVDVAATTFYIDSKYAYKKESLVSEKQVSFINSLIKKFNLYYVEDPLQEEDFSSFERIEKKALVVGDDLTATNIERLNRAIKRKAITGMIIKPNQNGSLLEVREIFNICKKNGIKTILSHRSGETLDSSLADYAFGFQADFIKCGIATKWREVKLKRLVEIEKKLN